MESIKENEQPYTSHSKKHKFSQIWNYFDKDKDKIIAKCNLCKKKYTTLGNTSNLHDHL